MSPEFGDVAFDPFATTKEVGKGKGLGLSICHGIVTSNGGRITLETAPGAGTAFRVELPAASPGRVRQDSHKQPDRSRLRGWVVIVDDEPHIRELAVRLLGSDQLSVTQAANGEELFRILDVGTPDLLLLDVRMPDEDGLSLYAKVTAVRPELTGRILFVTGDSASDETRSFFEGHSLPSLAKPFDAASLIEAVTNTLVAAGPEAPSSPRRAQSPG